MISFSEPLSQTAFGMLYLHVGARLLGELCVAGTTLGIIYNLFAAFLVLRFKQTQVPRPATPRSISVLKPLRGCEPGLFVRLASLCRQNYDDNVQIVCGTQDPADHAIHSVRLLQRRFPGSRVDLVVDERPRGANRKVANLVNMEATAQHDVVLLSDSDIAVDSQFLSNIMAALEAPSVGAVSCLYYGVASGGIWARASALSINSQFLPNVIVALTFGAAKPCFGSAIAMRKATLMRIGGLRAFLDELADDHAIGRAVRGAGLEVAIPRLAVAHVCFERNLRAFWDRHMRAARTIRLIDPIGYLGFIFMHPLTLSLIAAFAGTAYPFALVTAAFASRTMLSYSVAWSFRLQRQALWLIALHDTISFAVFLSSFLSTAVAWRGSTYHLFRDGTMEEENE